MSGRIRSIKPEWLEDERLALTSPEARVLSVALLLLADDHGNGRMVPQIEASRIFPASPGIFAKALEDLRSTRFIELYRLDGQTYFSIRNWTKHQRVDKPGKPRVPGPLADGVEKIPEGLAKVPGSLATDPDPDPDPDPDHDPEHRTPLPKTRKRKTGTPSAPSASPLGYREAVDLWFAEYRQRYGQRPVWGAVYGRQIQNILKRAPIEELRTLVPAFFAWQRPEVIKGGHSLSTGYTSFAMKLDELRADLLDPNRRAFAAQVQAREKLGEQVAADNDQINRVKALMAQEDPFEQRRMDGTAQRLMAQPLARESGALNQVNSPPGRDARQEAERPGGDGLVQSARPVRDHVGAFSSAGGILRGRADAEHRESQKPTPRTSRAGGVQTDPGNDTGGA